MPSRVKPSRTGGSRWSSTPSATVKTTNAGQSQAPRRRQRSRAGQKRSSGLTGARVVVGSIEGMSEPELWVAHLGTLPYREGVTLQEQIRARRQAGEIPDSLLLLERPPVYTKCPRTEPTVLAM